MNTELISLLATIFLALVGYMITYWYNIRISKRREQLELVNKRISEFYGPMYVATQSAYRAYDALLQKLDKEKGVFTDENSPATDEDKAEWFLWMKKIFMPNNVLIEKLIVENAYLIQEPEMPEYLLLFVTHLSGYKANMAKWEQGDFSETFSIIDYPYGLNEYIEKAYKELKSKQVRLIGKI